MDPSRNAELFQELSSLCSTVSVLGKYCDGEALALHDSFTDWVVKQVSARLSRCYMSRGLQCARSLAHGDMMKLLKGGLRSTLRLCMYVCGHV